ncbi:Na(+)/H(+) antiporter NhaA [Cytophagales bacterium WSM2-2]|nr:Na(+)/H(+) antiporter NhaA [Cytophagales bacterium WSM2-2]
MRTWIRHSWAFFKDEKAGGILLILCTITSLLLANSFLDKEYGHLWHTQLFFKPVEFWINDGLMTVFFLQVGLEIEREIYAGELNNFKKSLLPVLAALGGMLVPAIIHFSFNQGTASQNGYGIPMATDIAFSLGLLSLLGKRVPLSLKIFLTALAIIDDLGAILVIALFYSSHFSLTYLSLAFLVFAGMIILNRLNVYSLWVYLVLGCVMWFCMHRSGIHATISGVMLAFAIPFRTGDHSAPSTILQHAMHKPVTFVVLPLFALANTAITIPGTFLNDLASANSLGISLGLIIGKPVGIFLLSWIGIVAGWCALPSGISLKHIITIGMLAGIGFTMSIFITLLAFSDAQLVDSSKIAVLTASVLSGVLGLIGLALILKKK